MKVHRGYKTELDLNDRQRTACRRHAGAARYSYDARPRVATGACNARSTPTRPASRRRRPSTCTGS
ncbi:MAG: helix-turn-helix domain-containing protein [Chloroflexi bacterium]|nr:helix-turn-helix domain-containing protein [Chloroflexota bacterium]MBU1752157.1 helix-turn-helix domain-containing protein [Chloroflexota bacterium]